VKSVSLLLAFMDIENGPMKFPHLSLGGAGCKNASGAAMIALEVPAWRFCS
jgi:hypothetical protein